MWYCVYPQTRLSVYLYHVYIAYLSNSFITTQYISLYYSPGFEQTSGNDKRYGFVYTTRLDSNAIGRVTDRVARNLRPHMQGIRTRAACTCLKFEGSHRGRLLCFVSMSCQLPVNIVSIRCILLTIHVPISVVSFSPHCILTLY